MMPHSLDGGSQVLRQDGECIFRRGWCLDGNDRQHAVLIVLPATDHPSRSHLNRLTHEYELKDEFDGTWAVSPLDLLQLVINGHGGRLCATPNELRGSYFSSPCPARRRCTT